MFFTEFTRFSSEVQKANNNCSPINKKDMLREMYALVDVAEQVLTDEDKDLDIFVQLLNTTWNLKRRTGTIVSNDSIDALYAKGIGAGALGGNR